MWANATAITGSPNTQNQHSQGQNSQGQLDVLAVYLAGQKNKASKFVLSCDFLLGLMIHKIHLPRLQNRLQKIKRKQPQWLFFV